MKIIIFEIRNVHKSLVNNSSTKGNCDYLSPKVNFNWLIEYFLIIDPMYMYVCVCVYTYIYIYICVCVCVLISIFTSSSLMWKVFILIFNSFKLLHIPH